MVSYILYWKDAKFQLEESENKDVIFFPSKFMDPSKPCPWTGLEGDLWTQIKKPW